MDITELEKLMQGTEGENLEFKKAGQKFGLDELTEYCVALANEGGEK
jgi:ATP-dependent DNA helicase RecG